MNPPLFLGAALGAAAGFFEFGPELELPKGVVPHTFQRILAAGGNSASAASAL